MKLFCMTEQSHPLPKTNWLKICAAAVGLLGLLYGPASLPFRTTFAIGSFRHANTNNLRHLWRASWHSLEIYALLILIVFAPPSLIEIMNS